MAVRIDVRWKWQLHLQNCLEKNNHIDDVVLYSRTSNFRKLFLELCFLDIELFVNFTQEYFVVASLVTILITFTCFVSDSDSFPTCDHFIAIFISSNVGGYDWPTPIVQTKPID